MAAIWREEISIGCLDFGKKRRVTSEDMRRCAELACRVRLPAGRTIAHMLISHFVVDDAEVADPMGMECARLSAYAVVRIAARNE